MKKAFLILLLACSMSVFAQKQANTWYFGYGAGVNFNGAIPTVLTNGQTYDPVALDNQIECSASISDSTGTLLFYTNGMKIWNADQQVMPNGDGILGNFSSTQGALIVPEPGSSRYFYVFTVDDGNIDNLEYGFRYSVVDMCLGNRLGDVIADEKNIKLLDTVTEKLAAVRHANGTDYWIIVHKYYSDAFYAYHLAAGGITDTVISQTGSRHPSLADSLPVHGAQAIGQMKISPNGKKLAIVNGNSAQPVEEYFDFDNSTGIVSNFNNLQTAASLQSPNQLYGVSFSPDNTKLYVASFGPGNNITQFDLNAGGGNVDSVRATQTLITSDSSNGYLALQLGTDGRIYVTRFPTDTRTWLGSINFPNTAGIACNYVDSAINLNGKAASMGLPNFITGFDYSNAKSICQKPTGTDDIVNNDGLALYPNPAGNTINMSYQLSHESDIQLRIDDATGRKVLGTSLYSTGNGTLSFDISSLSNGVYIIALSTVDGTLNRKFVKAN